MKVSEAINTRLSVRAFLDKPVPETIIRNILDVARRAPSGGNLQPWHVYVLGGEKLTEFVDMVQKKLPSQPAGEGTEYNIYPPSLKEPYRSRRYKVGEDMYSLLDIPREDKKQRLQWFARNYSFFGAPAALFFAIDR
ncbi:MAG: nitroreductase family protein, partial [Parvularculales bacterium]